MRMMGAIPEEAPSSLADRSDGPDIVAPFTSEVECVTDRLDFTFMEAAPDSASKY